jgi:hypothetical protein
MVLFYAKLKSTVLKKFTYLMAHVPSLNQGQDDINIAVNLFFNASAEICQKLVQIFEMFSNNWDKKSRHVPYVLLVVENANGTTRLNE